MRAWSVGPTLCDLDLSPKYLQLKELVPQISGQIVEILILLNLLLDV